MTETAELETLRTELDHARRELDTLRQRCAEANRIALRQNGELTRLDDAFRRGEAVVLQLEKHASGTPAIPTSASREELEESVSALAAQVDALGRDLNILIARVNTIVESRTWRMLHRLGGVFRLFGGRK